MENDLEVFHRFPIAWTLVPLTSKEKRQVSALFSVGAVSSVARLTTKEIKQLSKYHRLKVESRVGQPTTHVMFHLRTCNSSGTEGNKNPPALPTVSWWASLVILNGIAAPSSVIT